MRCHLVMSNADLGIALAASAATQNPKVNERDQNVWPLGKDWIDAHNAWNLNYVTMFAHDAIFAKLLIPSVLCSSDADVIATGWQPPVPNLWIGARGITLKTFIVFAVNSEFPKRAKGR